MITKLSLGFACACCCLWAADVVPMDVKLGQWETTTTNESSGPPAIPQDVLSRLTPDQRAKMEAAMKANGAPRTTTTRSCVTKEDLAKAMSLGNDQQRSCTRTLVSSSSAKQEIHLDCKDDKMQSTGTIKIEAVNSENVKGSIQMAASSRGQTMNVNYTFASKWIGPSCTESKGK